MRRSEHGTKNDDLFAFAGLWDLWEREGKKITSCTIITTSPNKLLASIHDRMPVILNKENEQDWLAEGDVERVLKFLKPFKDTQMKAYPISTVVNNPSNQPESIIKPYNS